MSTIAPQLGDSSLKRVAVLSLISIIFLPSSAMAFAPLHTIAIGITDLQSGYAHENFLGCNGYASAKALEYEYNLSSSELQHYGWENSYETCYTKGAAQVTNEVHQFYGKGGAHWFLQVMTGTSLCRSCSYRATWKPRIGQESVGYTGSGRVGVFFRQGRYTVEVSTPSTKRQSLIALARLVNQRIKTKG